MLPGWSMCGGHVAPNACIAEPPAHDDNLPKTPNTPEPHWPPKEMVTVVAHASVPIAQHPLFAGEEPPAHDDNLPKADPVQPRHYKDLKPEPIEAIENWGLGFSEGNAVKYLARAGRKAGESRVDDLKKARWYVERALMHAEKAGSR